MVWFKLSASVLFAIVNLQWLLCVSLKFGMKFTTNCFSSLWEQLYLQHGVNRCESFSVAWDATQNNVMSSARCITARWLCGYICDWQIFYPETTDIYDHKNMPRVIYCIHALRCFHSVVYKLFLNVVRLFLIFDTTNWWWNRDYWVGVCWLAVFTLACLYLVSAESLNTL